MENNVYEKELSKDERIINVRKASTPEAFDDSVTLYAIRYISQEYEGRSPSIRRREYCP